MRFRPKKIEDGNYRLYKKIMRKYFYKYVGTNLRFSYWLPWLDCYMHLDDIKKYEKQLRKDMGANQSIVDFIYANYNKPIQYGAETLYLSGLNVTNEDYYYLFENEWMRTVFSCCVDPFEHHKYED